MKLTFIEATQGPEGPNWGKFMVARFDEEWKKRSALFEADKLGVGPLLRSQGWSPEHVLVLDLATGEGALFLPRGSAHHDLENHKIWVCPLFEPFLAWLYQQDLTDLSKLPGHVNLTGVEFTLYGYRRKGGRELHRRKTKHNSGTTVSAPLRSDRA